MVKTRTPQQARAKATVAAIVEAGFVSLSRYGLEGTSTRHIADIAGIGVGSLYEYFGNKEAVLDAMHGHVVAEVVEMIRPLIPELVSMEPREVVQTLLYRFRDLLQQNDQRYLWYAKQMVNFIPAVHLEKVNKVLTELLMQYLMHHPQLTRLPNIPAMSYIMISGGMFTLIRHLSDSNTAPVPFELLADGLADMVGHWIEGELRRLTPLEN